MKKRLILPILVMVAMVLSVTSYTVCADEYDRAYTMYSTPVIVDAELFDTYTADFYIGSDAENTYWSIGNFDLYLSEATKEKYEGISGGSGYAGVQHQYSGRRKAIIAYWALEYGEGYLLKPQRIYPTHDLDFSGESDGVSYTKDYYWQSGVWYRMVLHTWIDAETENTFMGMWLLNTSTGKWSLHAYYDTQLPDSCLTGDLHSFMENFHYINATEERDIHIKNIYVKLHRDKSWMSLDTSVLSHCNNAANNKTGAHSFGATEEYFWLKSGGEVEDQEAYDRENPLSDTFTIHQPDLPQLGSPVIESVSLLENYKNEWVINWKMGEKSSPQLSYSLVVRDVDGNHLLSEAATRPEIVGKVLSQIETDAFICELTVTDIYGTSVTTTAETEAYTKAIAEKMPIPNPPSDLKVPESKSELPLMGIILGAFLLIGGATVFAVLKRG